MTSGLGLESASRSAQRPRLCPSTTYGRCGGLGRGSRSRDEFEVSLGHMRPCLNKQSGNQLYIPTGASLWEAKSFSNKAQKSRASLVERTASGRLILGRGSEDILQHRHFYLKVQACPSLGFFLSLVTTLLLSRLFSPAFL